MPPNQASRTPATQPVVQMPAEMVERIVIAMEQIAAGQAVESAAEMRTALYTQVNEANVRLQTEMMATLAERFATMYQPSHRTSGVELSLEQRRAVLKYDAFRTALGRPGVASIVIGERSRNTIIITKGELPDTQLTLVAYAANGKELGRGPLTRDEGVLSAHISGLREEDTVASFELREPPDNPIRFGTMVAPIYGRVGGR
jgi:hypothetical protein